MTLNTLGRLAVILMVGFLVIGLARAVVSGAYPIGGTIDGCESDHGVQNVLGLGEVQVGGDVWMMNGSSVYRSSLIRDETVGLVPRDVRVLELPDGLAVVGVFAFKPRPGDSLLEGTFGGSGPIASRHRAQMIALDDVTATGWWPVVQLRVKRPGDYRVRGLHIRYRAGLRTVGCDHTTGVEFKAVRSA